MLSKYSKTAIRDSTVQTYCDRFCYITKNQFTIYKSKESFLMLQKSVETISLNSIKKVRGVQLYNTITHPFSNERYKKTVFYYFYIEVNGNANG
jgi:hypothetical protein